MIIYLFLLFYLLKIYSDVSVSAYQMNKSVGIYVIVDEPQMSIKYSLSVDIISWDVRQYYTLNSYVLLIVCAV